MPLIGFCASMVFAAAAITDWFDGWLARKWQVMTVLGKIKTAFQKVAIVTLLLHYDYY